GPCAVVQKKTVERDGYTAVQLGYKDVKESKLTKAELGHLKKAGVSAKDVLKEFKFENCDSFEIGSEIKCDIFADGDIVDVTGTSKGHGFSGVIKRWNSARLKETHGVGPVHREVGSLGANSDPSRVFPGKHMPGQYGNEQVTVLNLKVVKVDTAKNVLLIKGAIPGAKNSIVYIREAVKK
ncbi:MAG: 50S ribosomal protein L3, partial [Clostridia bacterium]|nr:50S ribosomal protein L3 [Clostridia bacterium]